MRWKAQTYGQDSDDLADSGGADGEAGRRYKVSPDTIAMLYDKWVMPMTKQVQARARPPGPTTSSLTDDANGAALMSLVHAVGRDIYGTCPHQQQQTCT